MPGRVQALSTIVFMLLRLNFAAMKQAVESLLQVRGTVIDVLVLVPTNEYRDKDCTQDSCGMHT
jgi:hypothetical protein